MNDLAFTPDGEHLVAVTGLAEGGDVIYWNLAADGVETTIHADDLGVWSTDVSDDGRLIVTGGQSSGVQVWNVAAGTAEGLPLPDSSASPTPSTSARMGAPSSLRATLERS